MGDEKSQAPVTYSPFWYWFGRKALKLIYLVVFRLKISGTENMPAKGCFFIASNHESFLDPPLIGVSFPYPIHYFARKTLFDNAVLGFLLPRVNVLPIIQERPDIRGMRTAIRMVQSGEPLVVFPEGARTPDGSLQRGQPGVGLLVLKTRCPVLPVRIRGAHAAWPRDSKKIRLKPLSITIGPLIRDLDPPPDLHGQEACQAISDRIMAAIAAL